MPTIGGSFACGDVCWVGFRARFFRPCHIEPGTRVQLLPWRTSAHGHFDRWLVSPERREQARGRVCEYERRRAKAICVWEQDLDQLGHAATICYSSDKTCNSRYAPVDIAGELLARSSTNSSKCNSMDRTGLFALTTRVRRATRLPDVIALCDEVERLARSATPPTVALQPHL